VDLRIISATNKDIEKLIEEQKFRLDLFHRINTFTLNIPPLRDRAIDIEPLLKHFVTLLCSKKKRSIPEINKNVISHLKSYHFPGNVRELRNMVERALILCDGNRLTVDDFIIKNNQAARHTPANLNLDENEKYIIEAALRQTDGNQIKAADLLGISRDALKHRIQKHGIGIHKVIE
jgi:two-component system, NtrC family, response regulator AtoC